MGGLTCKAATTADINASYSTINFVPTLTCNATGVVTFDGIPINHGDIVLIKDQSDLRQNGIYACTVAGAIGVAAVFSLSSQFNNTYLINNYGLINVQLGNTQANSAWVVSNTIIAIGTTNIDIVNAYNNNYINVSSGPLINLNASTNIFGQLQFTPNAYSTGTISQSGNTITGSGTTFTSAMDRGLLVPSSGSPVMVKYTGSGTSLSASFSQTIASSTSYTLYYAQPDTIDYISPGKAPLRIGTTNTTEIIIGDAVYSTFLNSPCIATDGFSSGDSTFYNTGTVTQSGTTITGSGTTFTSAMVGGLIVYDNGGVVGLITGFTSATSLTSSVSVTVSTATTYNLYYSSVTSDYLGNIGLSKIYLNGSSGNVIGTLSNTGAVTWVNKVNGSTTTNQTLTSSSTNSNFVYGNMTEACFDSICIAGAISGNFSGTNTVVENAFNGFLAVQLTTVGNGNQITFQTPGNLGVGVYMVEYGLVFGNISGKCDVTYKANGAGSFSNLRTGVDLYSDLGDGFTVMFREFITVTTAGNPLLIKWTANDKNASSTNYWVRPSGFIRVTLMG